MTASDAPVPPRGHTLSPRELAAAVGVSESSIKRWIDAGEVEAARTAGGHRRVSQREAVRFIRQRGLHVANPQALRLPTLAGALDAQVEHEEVTAQVLVEALVAGEAARVRALVVAAYVRGGSLAALCDGAIREALHYVGMLWKTGSWGIGVEHGATDAFIQTLHQIRSLCPPPSSNAPVAIGGAISGDPYVIPSLMAAAVMGDLGFAVTNLGPDIPAHVLADASRKRKADVVWLSVSTCTSDEALRRTGEELAAGLEGTGAQIVFGGQKAKKDVLSGSTVLPSMRALAALGETVMARRRGEA